MRTIAVIPARFNSSRFPGKPLVDILGKTMIQHVYERTKKAQEIDDVFVATDDMRIANVVKSFGGKVYLTSSNCQSGTERIIEIMKKEDADIYINVQGDEPLIKPEDIDKVAKELKNNNIAEISTLCNAINSSEANNPNYVKVVRTHNNQALYFSRSPIPFIRDEEDKNKIKYYRHIGLYGYTKKALMNFEYIPNSDLENVEKLEQLRFLQAGMSIIVLETQESLPGIDTPECLEKVKKIMFKTLK